VHWESQASVETRAAPAALWDAIIDGRRWSFWHDRFEWMWIEGPLAVGVVATLKPRGFRQTAFTISEVIPLRRFALETSFGPPARVRLSFDVEPRPLGARVAYGVAVDGILGSLAVWMIGKRLAAGSPEALRRLGEYAAQKVEAR
jgi:hypothetical protein